MDAPYRRASGPRPSSDPSRATPTPAAPQPAEHGECSLSLSLSLTHSLTETHREGEAVCVRRNLPGNVFSLTHPPCSLSPTHTR